MPLSSLLFSWLPQPRLLDDDVLNNNNNNNESSSSYKTLSHQSDDRMITSRCCSPCCCGAVRNRFFYCVRGDSHYTVQPSPSSSGNQRNAKPRSDGGVDCKQSDRTSSLDSTRCRTFACASLSRSAPPVGRRSASPKSSPSSSNSAARSARRRRRFNLYVFAEPSGGASSARGDSVAAAAIVLVVVKQRRSITAAVVVLPYAVPPSLGHRLRRAGQLRSPPCPLRPFIQR